ncbi:MAG: UDP-glucose 4-epimerase GalE [Deltaproteobacteria bacterium]|nr:UDP-glucose 4-epimerase GalE [Deltaproteobacteria bacterium]MBW2018628.1 UDP-glucose 4-epimerase GalE [Deltaproteobacteria bacterium]MBW2073894.1 UDP-glucose 4-epimerase GalE [Deltaproteobacteria bacterium]RLB81863.1 MAG: UDP-glucose 4-epimerase GalE [Deltaproteobacteria bacterium]
MKDILVVGGAGYIGSHMAKCLFRKGYRPIVLDNLVCGHHGAVKYGPFFQGSINDASLLHKIFSDYAISAVMHFAAFCYVGESVKEPAKYYQNNVANTLALLEVMVERNIGRFIFSSSCAIYGEPVEIPIAEDHPQEPINPYGRTKVMVEQILDDFRKAYGVESVCLRYFNAAGADPDGELGEDHDPETHLIPLVLKAALGQRPLIEIFGDDYPTPDGTCIRDYIHINDLAQAHLLALERLFAGSPGGQYNLGNGEGYSVKQVIEIARRVTGKEIPARVVARRPGDPAVLISSSQKAMKDLGWRPEFPDLETIVETAWTWHKNNPNGYNT